MCACVCVCMGEKNERNGKIEAKNRFRRVILDFKE